MIENYEQNVRGWLREASERGSAFLITVSDRSGNKAYPLYCADAQECRLKFAAIGASSLEAIEEVYDLSVDLDIQLASQRVMNLPQ